MSAAAARNGSLSDVRRHLGEHSTMDKFSELRGVAAPLLQTNIDTDRLVPRQFLATTERAGCERGLFSEPCFEVEGIFLFRCLLELRFPLVQW
jgi:hypothetical protein